MTSRTCETCATATSWNVLRTASRSCAVETPCPDDVDDIMLSNVLSIESDFVRRSPCGSGCACAASGGAATGARAACGVACEANRTLTGDASCDAAGSEAAWDAAAAA